MSVSHIISVIQIVICVVLTATILLQHGSGGVGGAFGGSGASYYTKRGFEEILFTSTIILAILFLASTIAALLIK